MIHELWKALKVKKAIFTSGYGVLEIHIYDEAGKVVKHKELANALSELAYTKRSSHYLEGDDHFSGELITVTITCKDDELVFERESVEVYIKNLTETSNITLTEEELNFFNTYCENIVIEYERTPEIRYKMNFIMTNELELIENQIIQKMIRHANNHYEFIHDEGIPSEYYYMNTGNIFNKGIEVNLTRVFTHFK